MSGFYFSSVPKLKIRRGGVVDNIFTLPPVPYATSVPGVAVPQAPETMVSSSSFIPLAPEVTLGVLSILFPMDDQARGRQPPVARRRRPCPGRGSRMLGIFG
ncbi:hypothetical protein Fot_04032 [Forsythia ovata]|uniref:Uncharacterized protein n=1 Tax=Forsythia ovata TaxID=205694 RepID=A0ABD1XEG5_9LAMI